MCPTQQTQNVNFENNLSVFPFGLYWESSGNIDQFIQIHVAHTGYRTDNYLLNTILLTADVMCVRGGGSNLHYKESFRVILSFSYQSVLIKVNVLGH